LSSIFGGSWGCIENWLEPKIKPLSGKLACQNKSVKRSLCEKLCFRFQEKLKIVPRRISEIFSLFETLSKCFK